MVRPIAKIGAVVENQGLHEPPIIAASYVDRKAFMTDTSVSEKLNERKAVELVMELMAIPGRSGEESLVADFITKRLIDAGADAKWISTDSAHRRTRIRGDVGNLILKLPGAKRRPRRLLTSHMDTVPICVGSQPVRRGDTISSKDKNTGLGADNRAGVGVTLAAVETILKNRLPHPPLTVLFTVQEEVGLEGARHLSVSRLGKPQLAFNWDGGAPHKLTVGATGGYRMQIEVEGIASHAGVAPEKGVSAISVSALAIARLHRDGWLGDVRKRGGDGTSNIGYIRGGEATNVVTDRVTLRGEARSHVPRFRQRIVAEIEKAFHAAAKEVSNVEGATGSAMFEGRLDYDSFLLGDDEPCLLAAEAAIEAIGRESQRAVANGGLDANWLAKHGIPVVTMGCGQRRQHMVTEALCVSEYVDACRIALLLATATDC